MNVWAGDPDGARDQLVSTVELPRRLDVCAGTLTVWIEAGCLDTARHVIGRQVWWDLTEARRCVAAIVDDDGDPGVVPTIPF